MRAAAVEAAESLAAGARCARGDQRHGRDRAHQPRPRPARREAACAAVGELAGGYSQPGVRPGARASAGSRQAHVEALVARADRRRGRARGEQLRGRGAARGAALAQGREVVVSRGQLVEIGGSFRIPDVIAPVGRAPGARWAPPTARGSPTTSARSGPETGAILRAHPSNFRTVGFVEEVAIEELCELGRDRGVPVIDDAGSGALAEGVPGARRRAGGATVGRRRRRHSRASPPTSSSAVLRRASSPAPSRRSRRCRSHPLARALRIDKLSLAALDGDPAPLPRSEGGVA